MSIKEYLTPIRENVWEISSRYKKEMRVPGRIYLSEDGVKNLERGAVEQVANVACLPGIQKFSLGMPDIHYGYGFSIGGVAAFNARNGVISPGGVGFDINCGVRLVKTNLTEDDINPKLNEIIEKLFINVPSGVGSKGKIKLDEKKINDVLDFGAEWAVENGYGWEKDLEYLEENGRMLDADGSEVSDKAKRRGIPQLGSLGSGNHFLEIQKVEKTYEDDLGVDVADKFGLSPGEITLMIHTGSRGCGHQICSDYLRLMDKAYKKHQINIPDRQLACAPLDSNESQSYFKAMAGAANYAWANRQMILHWIRETFEDVFKQSAEDMEMNVLYDVAHNIAKKEVHTIKGKKMEVVVHRKGSTRAFGPNRKEIPSEYNSIGQPVIIPGTMGTASYILHGTELAMEETFGSTAHGAGRKLSRTQAKKMYDGKTVTQKLANKGILVKASSLPVVAEESPEAYKDVDEIVKISHDTGIAKLVAKVIPLAVAKG